MKRSHSYFFAALISGVLFVLPSVSNAGTAPSCIARSVKHVPPVRVPCQTGTCTYGNYDIATITNYCSSAMKIRVAWSWHLDSPCTRLAAYDRETRTADKKKFKGPYYGYQRTKTCS
jgi:hypothetical protein